MAGKPKDVFYFPHEAGAMDDERVEAIQRRFGNDGYAIYFKCLEMQTKAQGKPIDLREEWHREIFLSKCYVSEERFFEIVGYAAKIGLFDASMWDAGRLIFSPNLAERLQQTINKREAERNRKKQSSGGRTPDNAKIPPDKVDLPPENDHLPPEHADKEKEEYKYKEEETTQSVCAVSSDEKSNQVPVWAESVSKGYNYLTQAPNPNLHNFNWVAGYLTVQFERLSKERPDLTQEQVLECWFNTCDTGVSKNASSANFFKSVFERQVAEYKPKQPIKRSDIQAKPKHEVILNAPSVEYVLDKRCFKGSDLEYIPAKFSGSDGYHFRVRDTGELLEGKFVCVNRNAVA